MKKLLLILFIFCCGIKGYSQKVQSVKIAALKNYIEKADHALIINFWATWCKPCIAEIPYLQQTAQQYKDSGVELIMVSLDFPEAYPNDVAGYIKSKNLNGTFFWLDETDADHFCPVIDAQWQGTLPATLFFNNKNKYRKFFEGKISPIELKNSIQQMLQ